MRDSDRPRSDLRRQGGRAVLKHIAKFRAVEQRRRQHFVNAVRAADIGIRRAIGIRTTASHADVGLPAKLRLDVARKRHVARCTTFDDLEVLGRLIEPVNVAVQNRANLPRLGRNEGIERIECERIAVHAPHDEKRVAGKRGFGSKQARIKPVVDRTDPARILEVASFAACRRTAAHENLLAFEHRRYAP